MISQNFCYCAVLALATAQPLVAADYSVELVEQFAQQPDGKTLFGGSFSKFAGQPSKNLARLNRDGTFDAAFRPSGIGFVTALAVQADGKILVGGHLTDLGGRPCIFARLNPDGYPDGVFVLGDQPDYIASIVIQEDGKILLVDPFNKFFRLNADGTADTSFITLVEPLSVLIQPDQKILFAGESPAGQPPAGLARLNTDGTFDPSFLTVLGRPWTAVLQSDGKTLASFSSPPVAGLTNTLTGRFGRNGALDTNFNSAIQPPIDSFAVQTDGNILALVTDQGLYRLNQNGSMDTTFGPFTNSPARTLLLGLQEDGKVVYGGVSTVRVIANTQPSIQSLSYSNGLVTWVRGPTSPDLWWSLFEYSTNGTDWISLGNGIRIPGGGWQVSGALLPAVYTLRARGPFSAGLFNFSFWFAESSTGSPFLAVQPASRTNYVGTYASLAVGAQGTEPFSYQWLRNGVAIPNATNNILQLPNIQTNDPAGYSAIVSNQFDSLTSSVATISVVLPPKFLIENSNVGLTNGQFTFTLAGRPGDMVVVDFSGNLVNWVPVLTNVLTSSVSTLTDPRVKNYPRGFYRARVLQFW